ncbi:MAG: chloride channel protein [Myxococcales bacterium]|nr:chloride channel protein [Myxococcales bacterium]
MTKARFSPTERQRLFGLTILIGGVCGLVAVAFHLSIRWVESITIEPAFEATGDIWIAWVIAVPTLGALVSGVMLYYLPGARGSGVPQVKVAYASKVMKLRLRDSVGKFVIGTIQIGTGSSLGREGPTVQICSGVAKAIGKLGGVTAQNLKLLLPVGSAAGIAAAFNAPIAAVTFTIEEIVGKLDQTLLSGVIVAAALAAVVERSVLGENPVFTIPMGYGLDHASSLVIYAALGVVAALVSVAFTESLLVLRKRFNASTRMPVWFRPAIGGLVTGVLAVTAMYLVHTRGITGGGYGVLGGALSGQYVVGVLLALGALKLVATVFSYASGGAGGIFAPSLFMGAMLGGAFGALDVEVFGHAHSEVGSFALVGMGAVFAGTVRAPITSVLIIIEMTAGYGLTLPLMIANMMAYGLARQLRPTPIYEALLEQDGVQLHPKVIDAIDGLAIDKVKLDVDYATFTPSEGARRMLQVLSTAGRQEVFPVLDKSQRLVGLIVLADLTALAAESDLEGLVCAADIMRPPVALRPVEVVNHALHVMMSMGVRELPVVDAERRVLGLLDEAAIAHEYMRARTASKAAAEAEAAGDADTELLEIPRDAV